MTQRLRQWLRTMEGINWCKRFQIDFLAQYQRRCQRLQCIDICSFTEVNGFKHLIICIDYFSKWSEAKHIKNKSVSTIGQLLYEVIRRRGCMKIQMNNHGWEFVNEVSKVLHNMTVRRSTYFRHIILNQMDFVNVRIAPWKTH